MTMHNYDNDSEKHEEKSNALDGEATTTRRLLHRPFADPWSFLLPTQRSYVTNLHGQIQDAANYFHNGEPAIGFFDASEYVLPAEEPHPEDVRKWLREHIIDTLFQYDQSGRFTNKEVFTMHRLWLDGWSLRRVAEEERVKPQAIRERIEGNKHGQGGLLKKAPEFYRWWAFKQRRRRMANRTK